VIRYGPWLLSNYQISGQSISPGHLGLLHCCFTCLWTFTWSLIYVLSLWLV